MKTRPPIAPCNFFAFALAGLMSVSVSPIARAATFTQACDVADANTLSTGTVEWDGQTELRVGSDTDRTVAGILVFQLPDIGDDVVTNAHLTMRALDNMWFDTVNADLYGLRHSSSPTVLTNDHFTGALDASKTLIQDDILTQDLWPGTGGVPAPEYTNAATDIAGDAALAAWVQSEINSGATAGDYLFIRLSPDGIATNSFRYLVASANHTTEEIPMLVLDTETPAVTTIPTNIAAHADDQTIYSGTNGADWVGQATIRAGRDTAERSTAAVMVFQLPDLGGASVVDANLSFSAIDNMWSGTANADLYGVRYDASSAVVSNDYFLGALDATATLVEDNILDPELTPGPGGAPAYTPVNTSVPGDAALAAWIKAQYDGGAVAGDYVFLRLSVDADPGSNSFRYRIASANSVTDPTPVLTLHTPLGGGTTYTIQSVLVGNGSALPAGDVLVDSGSSTQIVFTANQWHEISAFLTDGVPVPAADAETVYTASFVNVTADISNHVTFVVTVADADDKTPATWYGPLGADPAQNDEDNDGLTLFGEYLVNTDPTTSNLFAIVESGLDGSSKPFVKWNGLGLPNGSVVVDVIPDLVGGAWGPLSGSSVHNAGVTTWTADDPASDAAATRLSVQE